MEKTTELDAGVHSQGVAAVVNVNVNDKPCDSSKKLGEDELERLAVEALLQEARRGKVRAEQAGPSAWRKCELPRANKRFLSNIVMGAMSSNRKKMKVEEEQPPRRHPREKQQQQQRRTTTSQSKPHSRSEKEGGELLTKSFPRLEDSASRPTPPRSKDNRL